MLVTWDNMSNSAYRNVSSFPSAVLTASFSKAKAIGIGMLLAALAAVTGCSGVKPGIVLYSDQDRSVVAPLVKQFEQEKGMPVQVVYAAAKDVQSGRGLSGRLRDESGAPQADLYWACGPEAIEALRQDQALDPYVSESTKQISDSFRGPQNAWYGLGARVRVLLYNTRLVPTGRVPKSIACLAQPTWKGRCALADPRTEGSANYHVLYLFKALPGDDAKRLLAGMKANAVQLVPDESAVVEAVASGKAAWGVTDSDLAAQAMHAGRPVKFLVADQDAYSTGDALGKPRGSVPTVGTPLLPAPLALLKNRPHETQVRTLMEFLLSERMAATLVANQPARLPTHAAMVSAMRDSSYGPAIDPTHLNTISADAGAIMESRPEATSALSDVFGPAPP
jgi:iron(III) transport system substrate-binding protein